MVAELTDREKQTLLGLVAHPEANDRELAEILDMKHSTVTAIRRRLQDEV